MENKVILTYSDYQSDNPNEFTVKMKAVDKSEIDQVVQYRYTMSIEAHDLKQKLLNITKATIFAEGKSFCRVILKDENERYNVYSVFKSDLDKYGLQKLFRIVKV